MIVDGMSVLKTTAGGAAFLTNGFAYNFFTQLTATLRKFPEIRGVIVCWEGGYEQRTAIYPEYKSGRSKTNAEIVAQRDIVKNLLTLVGAQQVYAPGHEGDNMGAWLVHNLGVPTLLYTNDRDWLQLIDEHVSVFQKSPFSEGKKNQRVEITRSKFEHYTGWPSPELYLKAKCIMGDGDEVPGMEGVGDGTARSYVLGAEMTAGRRQRIDDFVKSPDFRRNMLLADLRTPKELGPVWTNPEMSQEKTLDFLREIGWPSITDKFPAWWETYQKACG
jgi:5'-3' exonuclease